MTHDFIKNQRKSDETIKKERLFYSLISKWKQYIKNSNQNWFDN